MSAPISALSFSLLGYYEFDLEQGDWQKKTLSQSGYGILAEAKITNITQVLENPLKVHYILFSNILESKSFIEDEANNTFEEQLLKKIKVSILSQKTEIDNMPTDENSDSVKKIYLVKAKIDLT